MFEESDKMRQARVFLGESREEFAHRFGVTARTVEYWEKNQRKPRKSILLLLDRILREAILGSKG